MRYEKILPTLLTLSDVLPKRHRVRAEQEQLSCRPFYILGSGRNGSTLLGTMLNRHPDLLVIPEQFALPYATIRYRLLNWLDWQDLVKIVVGEYSDPKNSFWKRSCTHLIPELYAIPREQRSLRTLIDRIAVDQGDSTGRPFIMWGDKTPMNTRMFNVIKPVLEGSRFVFLLRDGRDVVSSYSRSEDKLLADHTQPMNAARIWAQSIDVLERVKKMAPPEDLFILRYEQLIGEPEKSLKALCAFLGVPFSELVLSDSAVGRSMTAEGMSHHMNLTRPLMPGNTGKWKGAFDKTTLDQVMSIIGTRLERMGYR